VAEDLSELPTGLAFTKGHGASNDFVLYADPEGALPLTPPQIRALADRRRGIGGDGVIRAVRCAAIAEGAAAAEAGVEWFMDYWNHDGSTAEMCGNGVRVFAEFLRAEGLVSPEADAIEVGTRAGVVLVRREDGVYAADLGEWKFPAGQSAVRRGCDCQVFTAGAARPLGGLSVNVGNPHVVVRVEPGELVALDLRTPPVLDPPPAAGANVEFVQTDGPAGVIRMRVHERGVGETRSCGTGAAAAALAAWLWAGAAGPTTWKVLLPGGTLRVRLLDDVVELAGPVSLVARGVTL
jgi:diaminopimelate epimerase